MAQTIWFADGNTMTVEEHAADTTIIDVPIKPDVSEVEITSQDN